MLEEAVAGNAVILTDPTDRAATAEVFRRVLRDEGLRESKAAAGRAWAQTLRWDDVARETLDFLESR